MLHIPEGKPAEDYIQAQAAERSIALHTLGEYWQVPPRPASTAIIIGYAGPRQPRVPASPGRAGLAAHRAVGHGQLDQQVRAKLEQLREPLAAYCHRMSHQEPPREPGASRPPSPLTTVQRKPGRARYDTAAVHAVLDAAPISHVATVRCGRPVVLPMAHGRIGDTLYLHGSAAAGLFRDAAAG
ncbi:MAG TPA: pyridoxamine 5'-phosphate oxidase family protein, partial [Trebonia sp.]|nr:pyridoxamine 5'-phosphate oxidase family protein [Trebonia sp.]